MQGRLSYAEECVLAGRAQAGDEEARNRLVVEHLGLARKLARGFGPRGSATVQDLTQEAALGIMHAARKFDPTSHPGVRFGLYAARWMRLYMGRAAGVDGLVRVPVYARNLASARVDDAGLSRSKRSSRAAAARILAAEFSPVGVDEAPAPPVGDDGDDEVAAGLASLPMIQRHVLMRLYGLDGSRPSTAKAAAEEIGCSAGVVREMARKALDRLRVDLERRRAPRPDLPRRDCAYPKKCNPNRRKG